MRAAGSVLTVGEFAALLVGVDPATPVSVLDRHYPEHAHGEIIGEIEASAPVAAAEVFADRLELEVAE